MSPSSESKIAERILQLLKERPRSFYEILQSLEDVEYRAILQAWGTLREQDLLERDEEGNYLIRGSER